MFFRELTAGEQHKEQEKEKKKERPPEAALQEARMKLKSRQERVWLRARVSSFTVGLPQSTLTPFLYATRRLDPSPNQNWSQETMPCFIHLKILPYFSCSFMFHLYVSFPWVHTEKTRWDSCCMKCRWNESSVWVFVKILHRAVTPFHMDSCWMRAFTFSVQRRTRSVLLGKVNPQEHTWYSLFTRVKKFH